MNVSPFSIRPYLGSLGYVSHSLSDLLINLTCRSSFLVHHHLYSPFSVTFCPLELCLILPYLIPGWLSLLPCSLVPSCMGLVLPQVGAVSLDGMGRGCPSSTIVIHSYLSLRSYELQGGSLFPYNGACTHHFRPRSYFASNQRLGCIVVG